MSLLFALLCLQDTGAVDKAGIDDALSRFKKAYAAEAETDRADAVRALAKTEHPRVLEKLAPLVAADGPAVRKAAVESIAGFSSHREKAAGALVQGLAANADKPEVLVVILAGLGTLKEPSTLSKLAAWFDHKDPKVAEAAMGAAGTAERLESVEPLIAVLQKYERVLESNKGGTVQTEDFGVRTVTTGDTENSSLNRAQALAPAATRALQSLTQQEHVNAKDWAAWWAKKKSAK